MTDKQALQALQREGTLPNHVLQRLRRKGLIKTRDVTNMDSSEGEQLLFMFFTDAGKRLLESDPPQS